MARFVTFCGKNCQLFCQPTSELAIELLQEQSSGFASAIRETLHFAFGERGGEPAILQPAGHEIQNLQTLRDECLKTLSPGLDTQHSVSVVFTFSRFRWHPEMWPGMSAYFPPKVAKHRSTRSG